MFPLLRQVICQGQGCICKTSYYACNLILLFPALIG